MHSFIEDDPDVKRLTEVRDKRQAELLEDCKRPDFWGANVLKKAKELHNVEMLRNRAIADAVQKRGIR